jgi:hypothetical protein
MEGHYLIGYGDRSTAVTEFAPINPTPASEEAEGVLDRNPGDRERVDALLRLVDGFETPYSIELLATVHFAASQKPPTSEPSMIAERVSEWSLRKARLFTERHVRVAAERLNERRLLP